MGICAVFRPGLVPGDLFDRALEIKGAFHDEISHHVEIFGTRNVQVRRDSIIVYCENWGELLTIKAELEKALDIRLPEPELVKYQGQWEAYFKSWRMFIEYLDKIQYPSSIEPDKFKRFAISIVKLLREDREYTLQEIISKTGYNEQTCEQYLEFMHKLGLLNIKPPIYKLEKTYRIGCPPKEELIAKVRSSESEIASTFFKSAERAAGFFFRPWQILLSPNLSVKEKGELLTQWGIEFLPELYLTFMIMIGISPLLWAIGDTIINEIQKLFNEGSKSPTNDPLSGTKGREEVIRIKDKCYRAKELNFFEMTKEIEDLCKMCDNLLR